MPEAADRLNTSGRTMLTTWKDFEFCVRPARRDDQALLAEFFTHVSPEDRRFRFLSAVEKVSQAQLTPLVSVDHHDSENFLAFDGDTLIGTAMLAADQAGRRGEVAISLRADYKNRGIGWALLDHVARFAQGRGFERIESVESRENRQALAVEKDFGFQTDPYPGDSTLVLVSKNLATD